MCDKSSYRATEELAERMTRNFLVEKVNREYERMKKREESNAGIV